MGKALEMFYDMKTPQLEKKCKFKFSGILVTGKFSHVNYSSVCFSIS